MRRSVRRSSEEIVCAFPLSLGTSADICSSTVPGHCSIQGLLCQLFAWCSVLGVALKEIHQIENGLFCYILERKWWLYGKVWMVDKEGGCNVIILQSQKNEKIIFKEWSQWWDPKDHRYEVNKKTSCSAWFFLVLNLFLSSLSRKIESLVHWKKLIDM